MQALCYLVSITLFLAAGALLIWGRDQSLGILALIVAIIISRILLIDVARRLDDRERAAPHPADDERG